jgi:hypothetical protein
MDLWMVILLAVLIGVQVVLLVGLVLNVNKILDRASGIRRHLQQAEDSGVGAQLTEAVAQLESVAHSLDRIAMRCDAIDEQLGEVAKAGAGGGGLGPEAVAALKDGIGELHEPLREIRDLLGRTKTERLADEIKRTLHNMGYDRVTIKTDLATVDETEAKIQVEVAREGVTAKGYVLVRDGGVVDQKISKPYEMFP